MEKFIYAVDASLSSTGVCVFDKIGIPQTFFNIPTDHRDSQQKRLKMIADKILDMMDTYPPELLVMEQGFSRYFKSTQTLFKVLGVISYLFADCKQIFYAPSEIKKTVVGNGSSDKMEVQNAIIRYYPSLIFTNNDQSDACACGLCYFIKEHIIEYME